MRVRVKVKGYQVISVTSFVRVTSIRVMNSAQKYVITSIGKVEGRPCSGSERPGKK